MNRNTMSHLTVTPTIARIPNHIRATTFLARIFRETGTEVKTHSFLQSTASLFSFLPQPPFFNSLSLLLCSSSSSPQHLCSLTKPPSSLGSVPHAHAQHQSERARVRRSLTAVLCCKGCQRSGEGVHRMRKRADRLASTIHRRSFVSASEK